MVEVEKKRKSRVQVRQGTEAEMHKMGYCFLFFGRAEEGSIAIKKSKIFCSLSPDVVIVVVVELDIITECRMPIMIIIPGSIAITVLIAA